MTKSKEIGWIGVDLDGTLAEYQGWRGPEDIGDPVPKMLARVKRWLDAGRDIRIFTGRITSPDVTESRARELINRWMLKHLGVELPITNVKDYQMIELWDDRAIQVVPNTGKRVDGKL